LNKPLAACRLKNVAGNRQRKRLEIASIPHASLQTPIAILASVRLVFKTHHLATIDCDTPRRLAPIRSGVF
jgi:hypothetical protein